MFLVDSHCHLNLLDLSLFENDVQRVIQRAQQADVQYFLNVCVKIKDFPPLLKTAELFPFVSVSVGLHPNDTEEEIDHATLLQLAQSPKVIAIGETGLDYYRTSDDADWQRERFRTHIRVAKQLQKPLIIHTRNAREDTLRILQEEQAQEVGGVMHCFSEDWEFAQAALAMNFYISFSGIVTFKNATHLHVVARNMPLDKMLVETDCPYLAPVPHRGKPNEPAYVRHTAEHLAALRGISLEAIAEQTTQNFFTLFKGAVRPHV